MSIGGASISMISVILANVLIIKMTIYHFTHAFYSIIHLDDSISGDSGILDCHYLWEKHTKIKGCASQ